MSHEPSSDRSTMIASVHIADVGARRALGSLLRPLKQESVPGLRWSRTATIAPLTKSILPSPTPGRLGLVAFWEDAEALDAFEQSHPAAAVLSDGWSVRLEPLRASGTWPGLPPSIETARRVDHEGPAVVLTLGWLKVRRAPAFLRASAAAEGAIPGAQGVIFATGLARPPFVATCSIWESSEALMRYAYGRADPAHIRAIEAADVKPFHKQSAFIRFRPFASRGALAGKNPLTADWLDLARS